MRNEVLRYDDLGDDVGVGYNQTVRPYAVVATVYVYPRRHDLQEEFEGVKAEISDAHSGAEVLSDDESVLVSNPQDHDGKKATYRFQQLWGGRQLPTRSDLYLFELDDWLVEHRFTYPEETQNSSATQIRSFMNSLLWPEP